MSEFDYESIDPGYYHKAMLRGSKGQRFWHKQKFIQAAEYIPNAQVTVLDIGCGPGSFFYILRKQNKKAKLIGTDLIPKQVKYAKTVEPSARWLAADATKLPVKAKSIDFTTMLEVIEHIPRSVEHKILLQIRKVLKKNGKLILTTPNYLSLWPIIEWIWNKLSPVSYEHQHINKKTIRSMTKSLRQAGFKVKKVKTFFIFSPFVAVLSPKFAVWLMKIEQKILPRFGSVIIIEATA